LLSCTPLPLLSLFSQAPAPHPPPHPSPTRRSSDLMQPEVHATTRTPGPSTVAPVVNEGRKPMSPVASADRTSASDTFLPRSTRSSNGLFASSGVWGAVPASGMDASCVERAIDDVHRLLPREADEIDRVSGHADREARILFRMIHRVDEHLAVEHVDVHVIARAPEERIEHRREVGDAILLDAAEAARHEARRQRDAVLRVAIRNLGDRGSRRVDAV